MSKLTSWDTYFLSQLGGIAAKSKDPSRKVGSVAVDEDNIKIMDGFCGFPMNVDDTIPERYNKAYKNLYTLHAEANIVALCARKGTSLKGATLYCNLHPCMPCATLIIQSGIKKVVAPAPVPEDVPFYHFEIAHETMLEAGIQFIESDNAS